MTLLTEKNNPKTVDIDIADGENIAKMMNEEDKKIAGAIEKILPQIGNAIDMVATRLQNGGRMAYFGSGTSGRIGVLDASEMPPTFGVDDDLIQGYISGGERAIRYAVENAEDSEEFAMKDLKQFNPQKNDIVVAISASGNPQYTLKVLQFAHEQSVLTIAITSNPEAKFKPFADIFLCTELGPEVISGSSRLKSGTAQKMIVNMLSTGAMIRLGKTYHNYMIDLQIHNKKLHERAVRFVKEICNVDEKIAEETLDVAGNVKIACVMLRKNCTKIKAEQLLRQNHGILRRVI